MLHKRALRGQEGRTGRGVLRPVQGPRSATLNLAQHACRRTDNQALIRTIPSATGANGDSPLGEMVIGRLKPTYKNANFPTDAEGRTYHLGTREGEVAPRLLSVGSVQRAEMLSQLLEPPAPGRPLFQRMSSRGFLTITGRFEGVPVSIVSTHMGMPNMDFVVRENRAVVQGQMAIVRLGTCGAVQRPAKLGDLLLATHGSVAVHRDPDYWTLMDEQQYDNPQQSGSGSGSSSNGAASGNGACANGLPKVAETGVRVSDSFVQGGVRSTAAGGAVPPRPYRVTLPVRGDGGLGSLLAKEAAAVVGEERVVQGLNASGDSFYSSQGRTGSLFEDLNETLLAELTAAHPNLISLEMETFQLLDLARCSKGTILAAGMCIALAERYSNAFLEYSKLQELEIQGGTAALRTLARIPLEGPAATGQGQGAEARVQYVWA